MKITEFIKECATIESPIGDLANDILSDTNFPSTKSDKEIIDYLTLMTLTRGTKDVFEEFIEEFKKIK